MSPYVAFWVHLGPLGTTRGRLRNAGAVLGSALDARGAPKRALVPPVADLTAADGGRGGAPILRDNFFLRAYVFMA